MQGVKKVLWSGKRELTPLHFCHHRVSTTLLCCKVHDASEINQKRHHGAYLEDVDIARYEPDVVLDEIHHLNFKRIGRFTETNPVSVFHMAGSIFTMKPGTSSVLLHPPHFLTTSIDLDVLDVKALQGKTSAADVFKDWPIDYLMHSGYTMWSVPDEIDFLETFDRVVRTSSFGTKRHVCEETVENNRNRYIRAAVASGVSEGDAEKNVTEAEASFKIAVELDFSALGMHNYVFFLPPQDAKNPCKVVEEVKNRVALKSDVFEPIDVDLSEMRLVPHPRFSHCPSTNWFKVVPKNDRVSWEADGYFDSDPGDQE